MFSQYIDELRVDSVAMKTVTLKVTNKYQREQMVCIFVQPRVRLVLQNKEEVEVCMRPVAWLTQMVQRDMTVKFKWHEVWSLQCEELSYDYASSVGCASNIIASLSHGCVLILNRHCGYGYSFRQITNDFCPSKEINVEFSHEMNNPVTIGIEIAGEKIGSIATAGYGKVTRVVVDTNHMQYYVVQGNARDFQQGCEIDDQHLNNTCAINFDQDCEKHLCISDPQQHYTHRSMLRDHPAISVCCDTPTPWQCSNSCIDVDCIKHEDNGASTTPGRQLVVYNQSSQQRTFCLYPKLHKDAESPPAAWYVKTVPPYGKAVFEWSNQLQVFYTEQHKCHEHYQSDVGGIVDVDCDNPHYQLKDDEHWGVSLHKEYDFNKCFGHRHISCGCRNVQVGKQRQIHNNVSITITTPHYESNCSNPSSLHVGLSMSGKRFYTYRSPKDGTATTLKLTVEEDIYCLVALETAVKAGDALPAQHCIKSTAVLFSSNNQHNENKMSFVWDGRNFKRGEVVSQYKFWTWPMVADCMQIQWCQMISDSLLVVMLICILATVAVCIRLTA